MRREREPLDRDAEPLLAEAPPAAHALYRTFDGLELEISGRKDGNHALIAASARSTGKDTAAEADQLNARLNGWEFESPDYKYTAMFSPLEDLLKKPPQPVKKQAATAKPAKGASPEKSVNPENSANGEKSASPASAAPAQ